jgi:signal transduction histidine kinase
VRRRLLCLAILPAGFVALVGAALIGLVLIREPDGSGIVYVALPVGGVVVGAVLFVAALVASTQARTVTDRAGELGRMLATVQTELAETRHLLAQRSRVPEPPVATAVARPHGAAVATHKEQVEVFVNLAHRLQSLVHREIVLLDDLENNVEDPDLLKGIFQVDHLATRVRRYAENLAVLGGMAAERQWTRPVSLTDVLRSAVAEVEQYSRVKLVPPIPGTLRGHAIADVVHLLAELAENATMFSPPQTRVLLRAEKVAAGLAVEVEDRGLGMTAAERNSLNALLSSPEAVILSELLHDGRIGLYVVSVLARRHGINVQLQGNIYGGTQAVVVLPAALLGESAAPPPPEREERLPQRAHTTPRIPARVEEPAGYLMATHEIPLVRENRATATAGMPVTGPTPMPVSPPVPLATPSRVAAPVAAAGPEIHRPALPTRRRLEHLAPQLRQPVSEPAALEEVEHDPGLMAAFQAGIQRAQGPQESDTTP